MSKNVLVYAYTAQNLGDDLLIGSLCQRYPDVSFHIVCEEIYSTYLCQIANLHVYPSIESLLTSLSAIKIAVQIFIGGSIFMEPNNKVSLRQKFNETRMTRLLCSVPFIVIGANFGPYTTPEHLALYKEWFQSLDHICFRDKASFDLFEEQQNIRWAPDILLLNHFLPTKRNKSIAISPILNDGRIGLSIFDEAAYIDQLVYLANVYIDKGFEIKIASFCQKQGDSIVANLILQKVHEPAKTMLIEYSGDPHLFLSEFLSSEYIIGTRLHSIILGWASRIPTFPISYNCKTENILRDYGFRGDWCHIDELTNVSFEDIDRNRKSKYVFDVAYFEKAANNQFKYLDALLESR